MQEVNVSQALGLGVGSSRGGPDFPLPRTAADVLRHVDDLVRRGDIVSLAPVATGFQPLDRCLDGGLRPGDLILVCGTPGVGKTTLTLQMARNVVTQTLGACAYVCYEHEETFLLQRLIALESFLMREMADGAALALVDLRQHLLAAGRSAANQSADGVAAALSGQATAPTALTRLREFGQRLYLLKASGDHTDIVALRQIARDLKEQHGPRVTLFVDYLQKVPVIPAAPDEYEHTTRVANGLKDVALSEDIPVVAVVAADREGLRAPRLRMTHFRGSTSLAYEADVTVILNNKYRIISKRSIAYNPYQAQEFRNWVVWTIEKNRSGRELVDLEFRAYFAHAAFDPNGNVVAEALIDERIDE